MGVRLLERNRRLVVPTEKGQELLGFAERLLRLHRNDRRRRRPHVAVRELFTRSDLRTTIHASASLSTIVRMALDGIGVAVFPPAILPNVAPRGQLRALKTRTPLPRLTFVVSWPSTPDSFAAQKVAEIATGVAKGRAMLASA